MKNTRKTVPFLLLSTMALGLIVAVTAAMTDALGLRPFFEAFPDRAFDVGICEEHASVLSAALAAAFPDLVFLPV